MHGEEGKYMIRLGAEIEVTNFLVLFQRYLRQIKLHLSDLFFNLILWR